MAQKTKTILSIGLAVAELLKPLKVKVYPLLANADTPTPYIVYARDGVEIERDKDGIIAESTTVTVHIIADTYSKSVEYAEQARELLTKTGVIQGLHITDSDLIDTKEERSDDNTYIQTLTLKYEIS